MADGGAADDAAGVAAGVVVSGDRADLCAGCGSVVERDEAFCPACGRSLPAGAALRAVAAPRVHDFRCRTCGASVVYDVSVKALRCPYCDSRFLEETPPRARRALPQRVVPFGVDEDGAASAFRGWLAARFWAPRDVVRAARIRKMDGLFLPFWLFTADVEAHWTADSTATRVRDRAPWRPFAGTIRRTYANVPIPASQGLSGAEIDAILPYDLAPARPFDAEAALERPFEAFAVSRRRARDRARAAMKAAAHHDCAAEVPGAHRKLRSCPLVTNAVGTPVLLPVWIFAWRYRDRPYRLVVNGQTGTCTGTAPVSVWKVLAAIAAALAVVALIAVVI